MVAIGVGASLGIALAAGAGIGDITSHGDTSLALPSRVYDRHGRLITEFFSSERREVIAIDDLPRHLIYALLVREDREFFRHNGFSLRGTARAAWNILNRQYVSGGSTISQQLAGHLFDDRGDFSIARKLRELWWAFQLEKHWSKHEILEEYLNRMYFGHNTYGVEAASWFYFTHSARDLTPAESAMLVIQLANPARYSPLRHPARARTMQRVVLNAMVNENYLNPEEADIAFEQYWISYDFTRVATSSAFLDRSDRAPYFSEYVRGQLEGDLLLGRPVDINRAGYSIHTTLDLDHQEAGEFYVRRGLDRANADVTRQRSEAMDYAGTRFVPILDLLGLALDMPHISASEEHRRSQTRAYYDERLAPLVSMTSLLFSPDVGDGLYHAALMNQVQRRTRTPETQVQGALVTLENETGYITAMIGGNRFERIDQFNRAVAGRRTPGSAFKPLFYVAALDDGIITPATILYDAPTAFRGDDGTYYQPRNYAGNWTGPLRVRSALARSLNVPAVQVFHRLGFTRALDSAAGLLGIPDHERTARGLERRYPVALGNAAVSPMEMARAYATFANLGMPVEPLAIRYVTDRDGRVVVEPERDLRIRQARAGESARLASEQASYLMTNILEDSFTIGTLRARHPSVPMAAKSGTTQNWSDGWVVGYSPSYTTAMWYGFDRGGRSLGTHQFADALVGPDWQGYMNTIHRDLPAKPFPRPEGIVQERISSETGLLAPVGYSRATRPELFIAGTEPVVFAPRDSERREAEAARLAALRSNAERRALLPSRASLAATLPALDDMLVELGSSAARISGHANTTGSTNTLLD